MHSAVSDANTAAGAPSVVSLGIGGAFDALKASGFLVGADDVAEGLAIMRRTEWVVAEQAQHGSFVRLGVTRSDVEQPGVDAAAVEASLFKALGPATSWADLCDVSTGGSASCWALEAAPASTLRVML